MFVVAKVFAMIRNDACGAMVNSPMASSPHLPKCSTTLIQHHRFVSWILPTTVLAKSSPSPEFFRGGAMIAAVVAHLLNLHNGHAIARTICLGCVWYNLLGGLLRFFFPLLQLTTWAFFFLCVTGVESLGAAVGIRPSLICGCDSLAHDQFGRTCVH